MWNENLNEVEKAAKNVIDATRLLANALSDARDHNIQVFAIVNNDLTAFKLETIRFITFAAFGEASAEKLKIR